MTPRWIKWFICALLLATSTTVPTAAHASDSCNAKIIDATQQHVLGDLSDIKAETAKLENLGADVYVRTFQQAPQGSLDAYYKSQVHSCANWSNAGGQPKGNLVVFMFSMDRQSVIFYGSNWHRQLDANVDDIRANYMNAQLNAGKFSDAIVKAEARTYAALNNELSPTQSQNNGNASSGDSSKAGLIFVWLLVGIVSLLAFLALCYGLYRLINSRRLRSARLADARTKAIDTRDAAILALGTITTEDVQRSVELLLPQLNDEDKAQLNDRWNNAAHLIEQAINAKSKLDDAPARYNPAAKHSLKEYEVITAAYQSVLDQAGQAAAALQAVDTSCTQTQQNMDEAPKTLARLTEELKANTTAHQQLVAAGFRTNLDREFATASQELKQAAANIALRKFGLAIGNLEHAENAIQCIQTTVESLPRDKAKLENRRDDLLNQQATMQNTIQEAARRLTDMKTIYASSCWRDQQKALDDSRTDLDKAQQQLQEAGSNLDMTVQAWGQTDDNLDKAESLLKRCMKSCEAISERATQLQEIAAGLPARVDLLVTDVLTQSSYVKGLKGSQQQFIEVLRDLEAQAEKLQSDLIKSQPDYIALDLKEKSIRQSMDDVVTTAKRVHLAKLAEDRRKKEEAEEEERRRNSSYNSGFATGTILGSSLSSSGGSSYDFGGGSSGSWGGDAGGGSSGSW